MYPITVAVRNDTETNKNIQVFYPEGYHLPNTFIKSKFDSLTAFKNYNLDNYLTSRDMYRDAIKVPVQALDTLNKKFLIELDAGYRVTIQEDYQLKRPLYGLTFVIDNRDTVVLNTKQKLFVKYPKIGRAKVFIYNIKN